MGPNYENILVVSHHIEIIFLDINLCTPTCYIIKAIKKRIKLNIILLINDNISMQNNERHNTATNTRDSTMLQIGRASWTERV